MGVFPVFFLFSLASSATADLLVETQYGPVHGFRFEADNGFQADVFLGIPYAKPPIENLRFQKPQPPEPWSEPIRAYDYGTECVGIPNPFTNDFLSEDCLFLNIAKPANPSTAVIKLKPVLFWIHGDAFASGSANAFHNSTIVTNFVSKGFVFVSINYRLGPFGFYSTGNDFNAGNYGLWDQVQALKFIQEIITNFEGDPKQITIFGESAGGASVSWQALREDSPKLFARAISMSGSHFSIWANSYEVLKFSDKLADELGGLEKFENSSTTKKIQNALKKICPSFLRQDSINFAWWNPRLDGDFETATNHQDAIRKAPKMPAMIGLTSQESIFSVFLSPGVKPGQFVPLNSEKTKNFSEKDFKKSLDFLLRHDKAYGHSADNAVARVIQFYEKEKEKYSKNQYLNAFVQFFSDLNFNIPALREARLKAAAGHEVYFYLYDYPFHGADSELVEGARHASILPLLFGDTPFMEAPLIEGHLKQIQQAFIELLTTFARGETPTADGKRLPIVTSNKVPYIEFGSKISIKNDLWPERLEFWNQMVRDFKFDWITGTWMKDETHLRNEL